MYYSSETTEIKLYICNFSKSGGLCTVNGEIYHGMMSHQPLPHIKSSVVIETSAPQSFSLTPTRTLRKMSAHPDSNLHPEATGAAKALVEKHSAKQPLKLYAGWFCP